MANIKVNKEDFSKVIEGIAHDLREAFADAAPKDTGFLMRNIEYEITEEGIMFSFPYYALYLEYGTGLYGPKKTVIRPKTKKALAWGKTIGQTEKGNPKKEYVYRYIKGMTPRPFIRPVFHQKFNEILIKNLSNHLRNIEIIL